MQRKDDGTGSDMWPEQPVKKTAAAQSVEELRKAIKGSVMAYEQELSTTDELVDDILSGLKARGWKSPEEVDEIERLARIDERESMHFLNKDGKEIFSPYLQYRFIKNGLIFSWENRTSQLHQTEKKGSM